MMKKYISFLILSVLSIIICQNVFAEGESSTAKQKEKNVSSIPGSDNDFSNESLFTGDVAFSVPITGFGGINIALNYNSNIHKLVRANNKDVQAGWVGLGWSLNLGSIVADINGTRDVSDDKYFYISTAGSTELIQITGNDFMLKEYQYWKITRSLDGNGNLIGWTIIVDDGTKMRLGNYNKATSNFVFDTTFTKATRFMLGWDGVVCNPLNNKYSSASFIAFQWDLSDIEDVAGNHTTISYQHVAEVLSANSVSTTLKYTQESHPLKITDWTNRSVEFVLGNLTTAEYVTPPDKIIQRLFERKYLNKILIKDATNSVVQQIIFDYSVLDIFNQSGSKRYLTSITVQDANNNSLTPTNFGYYITSGSLGENPGALKSITYPDGGKVEYTYSYQTLGNVDLDFTQTEDYYPTAYYPKSFIAGSDFYVVRTGSSLRVYRWGVTGWFEDITFPYTYSVEAHWVRNDYIVYYQGGDQLKIAKRKDDGWNFSTITLSNNHTPGSMKVIAASSNYFLVAHNLEKYSSCSGNRVKRNEELSVIMWDGNTWTKNTIGNFHLGCVSDNDDIHLIAATGRDFFVLLNIQPEEGYLFEYCRVYVRNGPDWTMKFGFYPDAGNWGDFDGHAVNLYAGPNYFITYLWRHPNHPEWRRIKMYNWPFNSVSDSLMYNNIDARNNIYTSDNFFVTVGGSETQSTGNQLPILTHSFNGNSSSGYPYTVTNIGDLLNTSFKHTTLALGKDYVSFGWITGNDGKLGIVKNVSGQWSGSYMVETFSDFGSDSYVTPVNNVLTLFTEWYSTGNYHSVRAYKEQNNNWTFNTELDNVAISGGIYQTPSFTQPGFQFLSDVINPGTAGNKVSHGFMEGNSQVGGALFSGSPADYPIATKTITDAMGNIYITNYTFENGVYDHDLNFAKYNKVTVEPPQQDNGKTITYFYNHLGPGQAEEFVDAFNYKELDGLPYKVKIYKQNDNINPISTTTNKWAAFNIDEGKGVYHKRLIKTISIIDGVVGRSENEYNNTNGQLSKITEPVEVSTDFGIKDGVTEVNYAFSQPQYSGMLVGNMLTQIYETKTYSIGNRTISVMVDCAHIQLDEDQFTVPFNMEVNYNAVVNTRMGSTAYFCIGTTPGGFDVVNKLYADASGSFQANSGIIYYMTAYCDGCSPLHGCSDATGTVSYNLSVNPDLALISHKRIEYDPSNNYLPFKTSVYDGATWITTNTISKRDVHGNVTESYNVNNVYSATKYGYDNALPIAQVTNSKDGESGYIGLESGWQDWETGGSTIASNLKHTGIFSAYSQNNYGPTKNLYCANGVDKNKSYILEAWVRRTGGTGKITIELRDANNNVLSIVSQDITGGTNWQLISLLITPQHMTNLPSNGYLRVWCGFPNSTSNYGYIDDVRFYPTDAMMTTYTYNPLTLQVTSGTDENNVTTFYEYDSFGRLIQTKNDDDDVLSQTTYYISREHNGGNFNPSDPNYIRTSTYPDGLGSTPIITTSFTDGVGRNLQTHSRDGSNDIISAVSYDNAGRPNKAYNPYSLSNPNHTYDPNYASASSGYIETQYYSDPLGRVQWKIPQGSSPSTPDKNIESVYGNAAVSGVSAFTNDIKQKPATNSVNWLTSRSYRDRLGRVVKSSVLDGSSEIQTSTTLYNMLGLPVQVTDPKGMQQNFTYDFLGRLKVKTTPDAGASRYIYGFAGRLRFMLDADGDAATPDNILYWKYDTFGRVTEKGYIVMDWNETVLQIYANTDPDYPTTPATWRKKFTYDNDGVSLYLKGRLYRVETNNDNNTDTEVEETFTYSKYGFVSAKNLTVMETSTQMQSTLYEYDNLGRLTKITYPSRPENLTLQDETISGTTPIQYEANNNIDAGPDVTINYGANVTFKAGTSIHLKPGFSASSGSNFRAYIGTFTDGGTPTEVVYTYNQRGLISGVGTTTYPTYYASYTYTASGQIQTEILNDSQRNVNYSYNIKGYPTSINSALFTETLTYETDGYGGVGYYHGNIASTGFTYYSGGPAAYQTLYQYDNLGRLKIADNNLTALNQYDISNITYDNNGNIISINKGGTNYTYNYYYGTNKLQNTDGSGDDYVYDVNGNITTSSPKNIPTITYDPFTQMTKNITITGSPTHTVNFQYTADNERILKAEKQGTTNNTNVYIRGANEYPLTEKINLNSTLNDKIYIYGSTGLIAFKDATATYFIIKDHLGSTRVLFKSTGTQYSTYDYSPFGSLMRSSINGDVRYRFTGQEYDSEFGLYNFRARLYDDEIGIFYAVDPSRQNFSPFSYAGNNPVIFVDKDGRWFIIDDLIVSAVSFVTGYLSHGLTTGNWGWNALKAGGISAGVGLLSYYTGGAAAGLLFSEGSVGYAMTASIVGGTVGGAGGSIANQLAFNGKVDWNLVGRSTVSGFGGGLIGGAAGYYLTGDPVLTSMIGGTVSGGIEGSYEGQFLQGAFMGSWWGGFSGALTEKLMKNMVAIWLRMQ